MQFCLQVDTHRVKWEQDNQLKVTSDILVSFFSTLVKTVASEPLLFKHFSVSVPLPPSLRTHLPDVSFVRVLFAFFRGGGGR